jgi:quinol monooxygenase YgiN
MPELTVVAVLSAQADAADDVREGLAGLTRAARTEDGCISYDLFVDAANANRFVTVEKWESQDALDAHFISPAMAEATTKFAGLDGAPLIVVTTPVDV